MPDSRSNLEGTVNGGGAVAPISTGKKKRDNGFRLRGDNLTAILVLLPAIAVVAIFIYYFIVYTFVVSMVKWPTLKPDFTFVGLDNYIRMFNDTRFRIDIRNLVLFALGFMTQCIVIGFLLATLLDSKIKSEAVFRTIFVFPFAVSGIVTGVVWRWLMFPSAGLNQLLASFGITFTQDFKWYASPRWGILAVSIAASWQFAGYVMALYLAGLRGINAELKEAAAIDGANTWQLYRRIIIPLLAPVTFTVIVLTGMGSIRVFDIPAVLGTGAAFSTDMLAFHMFQLTFQSNRIALGAVIASVMIMLAALLVGPYLASLQLEDAQ
jgi:glucose/mannose transport system permease protein